MIFSIEFCHTINFDGPVYSAQRVFRHAMVSAKMFFSHLIDSQSHFRFVRGLFKRRFIVISYNKMSYY